MYGQNTMVFIINLLLLTYKPTVKIDLYEIQHTGVPQHKIYDVNISKPYGIISFKRENRYENKSFVLFIEKLRIITTLLCNAS